MANQDQAKNRSTEREALKALELLNWDEFQHQVLVLGEMLEKMRLAEYIAYLNRPLKLLLINFGVGILRGLGGALGASIIFGLVLIWLRELGMLNLPVIGGLIAELVKVVNSHINQ